MHTGTFVVSMEEEMVESEERKEMALREKRMEWEEERVPWLRPVAKVPYFMYIVLLCTSV